MKTLLAWIGLTDIKCSCGELGGLGPIGRVLAERSFDRVVLLYNYAPEKTKAYLTWLNAQVEKTTVEATYCELSSPTNHADIFEAAVSVIEKIKINTPDIELTYHISPGTPAMASVWVLLGKAIHPAELIESSVQSGVRTVSFPFDLHADYLETNKKLQADILKLTKGLPPTGEAFEAIIHRCDTMKRLVARAQRIAGFEVPVLIQGESGTGKELLAKAIHESSPRKGEAFIAVNCGAIPKELFESEFFGHVKGAFTGSNKDRVGFLEAAHGGTLFLDEIGELPKEMQVKLLRALQEKKIRRVGDSNEINIDFRVVAATNRTLLEEVASGNFREDLFHRLAVGVLQLPTLRERKEDLSLLVDHFLNRLNQEYSKINGKKFCTSARKLIVSHSWPGNIRELSNTLSRIFIWSVGDVITDQDVKENLFPVVNKDVGFSDIMERPIIEGFELESLLSEVESQYLSRAMIEAGGNKSKAARMLGLKSQQTLSGRLKKCGI